MVKGKRYDQEYKKIEKQLKIYSEFNSWGTFTFIRL